MTALTVPRRFNGPPGSANGGVTCGLLAARVDAPVVEVTLRRPPPLGVPMRLEDAQLYDGDALVAQARPGAVELVPAAPVSVADAAAAASAYAGHVAHPFPTCFVCGPEHPTGLHLFPGPVGEGVVAVTWTPEDGDPVMVWAALDCPSGWSTDLPGRPLVLGRMACKVERAPIPGQPHVVMGWHVGDEGRKVQTGSALYDADGSLLAVAQQTWIALT